MSPALPVESVSVVVVLSWKKRSKWGTMPDYMAERRPELMPKVTDNLVLHMIGDVVLLVTQPMLDYLKGKTAGLKRANSA